MNNQSFRHYCHEWDGLLIDINSPEIECCLCYSNIVSFSLVGVYRHQQEEADNEQ